MIFYKKTALIALFFGLIAQSTIFADNKYWQEFKTFKENPSYRLIFDREAARDAQNNKQDLSLFQKWVTLGVVGDSILVDATTMPLLYAYIEGICKTHGMAIPLIAIKRHQGLYNAFAFKLFMDSGAVGIGQDLLEDLDDAQFEAVIAHELGHIYNNHVNKSFLFAVSATIALAALECKGLIDFVPMQNFLSQWYVPDPVIEHVRQCMLGACVAVTKGLVIGKRYEKQADEFACKEMDKAEGLIAFMERLKKKEQEMHADEDAFISDLEVHLANNKPSIEIKFFLAQVKLQRTLKRLYRWIYHNTFFGAHPSNEDRHASATRILQEQIANRNAAATYPDHASLDVAPAA